MRCPDFEELAAYQQGHSTLDRSGEITRHLTECPRCQAMIRDTVSIRQSPDSTSPSAPDLESTADATPVAPSGYELLEPVGRGGMGLVYAARDLVLNRHVAIKFMRARYSGDAAAEARFEYESQITGQLQHPGIPAIHQLGINNDGVPFLAMKLVKGNTLAEQLSRRDETLASISLGRLLTIFEQVCHAVGYAHSRNVIHRDLKPLNVMVGAFGEVQVMDWGLAKYLGQAELPSATTTPEPVTPSPQATQAGTVMGTVAYMSPEQASGEVDRLDARCDVFALGSMLCQILTGRPAVRGKTLDEALTHAVQSDYSGADEDLDQCDADADLIALCKCCLATELEQRPADASEVANRVSEIRLAAEQRARQAELERARALVRESEQAARRRVVARAAAAIVGLLVIGIVGTTWGLVQARRQGAIADRRRQEAETAQGVAEAAALAEAAASRKAHQRLGQIEMSNEALLSIFSDLDIRIVRETREPLEATLAKRLLQVGTQFDAETVGDPLMVAALQSRLGETVSTLGHPHEAIDLLEKAAATQLAELGSESSETLESQMRWCSALLRAGRMVEAVDLLSRVSEVEQRLVRNGKSTMSKSFADLAVARAELGEIDPAIDMLNQHLEVARAHLGPSDGGMLSMRMNLAELHRRRGDLDTSIGMFEEVVSQMEKAYSDDHPDTIKAKNNLGVAYRDSARFSDAVPLLEEVVAQSQSRLGGAHPDTLRSLNNLGECYAKTGQLDMALPVLIETLKLARETLREDHDVTQALIINLAAAYFGRRQYDLSLPLYEEAVQLMKARAGDRRFQSLATQGTLGWNYAELEQYETAIPILEGVADEAHQFPQLKSFGRILFNCYVKTGQIAEATAVADETLNDVRATVGANHPQYPLILASYGLPFLEAGAYEQAEPILRESLEKQAAIDTDAWPTCMLRASVGAVFLGLDKPDEAEPLLVQGYQGMKAAGNVTSGRLPDHIKCLDRLISLYESKGNAAEAEKWRAERESLDEA